MLMCERDRFLKMGGFDPSFGRGDLVELLSAGNNSRVIWLWFPSRD